MGNSSTRMNGESAKAFEAYSCYRDIPAHDRSIRYGVEVMYGEDFEKKTARIRQWERWSSRWEWVRRVAEWEEEKARVAELIQIEEIEKMVKRHTTQSMLLQKLAVDRLQEIKPADLTPALALKYLLDGIAVERTSRGEPSEKIDLTVLDGNPKIREVVVRLPVDDSDSEADEEDNDE